MFNETHCRITQVAKCQNNKSSNEFIKSIFDEDTRVKALHLQEIKATAENPRIRAQNMTSDISAELRSQKRQDFLEQKRRQQLRENNQDLRQLQIHLRAALSIKELTEQRAQSERDRIEKEQKKHQENVQLEAERLRALESLKEFELNEHRKKETLRGVLRDQMAEKRERQLKAYEEILNDREQMNQLLKRMEAEHAAEARELELRKERTKEEMHKFLQSQELLKLRERSEKVDDNKQILEFQKKREEKAHKFEMEKQKEIEDKQKKSNQIGQQLYEIQKEKKRREDLLLDLLVEERKTKEDFRFRQNLEKKLQERTHVRRELEKYRQEVQRYQEIRQKEEDDAMRDEQMRIMAEKDKLEQLSDERRRQKIKEYRHAIQQMIEEKRRQRANEASELLEEYELLTNEDQIKQQEVEDERLKILQSQPSNVLCYLRKGVLREADREFLALPPNCDKK